MAAFLVVLAVMVACWFLAILAVGMCRTGAAEDRARARALAAHRARVIDLAEQRRRRNTTGLGGQR